MPTRWTQSPSESSPPWQRVTTVRSRNLTGLCCLHPHVLIRSAMRQLPAVHQHENAPCSGPGMLAVRCRHRPPISLRGSTSSSKLVRDDAYPLCPFIRSTNVDDADDDDADRELALDSSERRERGSGGTSGTPEYEARSPRPPRTRDMSATERWVRMVRDPSTGPLL